MTCIAPWGNYDLTPTVALALDVPFAEMNEKIFPNTALPLNSKFKNEIFASSPGSLVNPIRKNAALSHFDSLHTSIRTYR